MKIVNETQAKKEIKKQKEALLKHAYEHSDKSLRALAQEFNINYVAIKRMAEKNNWKRDKNMTHFEEIQTLQHVEKQDNKLFIISDELKLTSENVICSAFYIIEQLHNVHNKALKANNIIIDNVLTKLENNTIEYNEAVTILQRLGAGLDKISSFYKEPALTNIQINNNNKQEPSPVINIIAS